MDSFFTQFLIKFEKLHQRSAAKDARDGIAKRRGEYAAFILTEVLQEYPDLLRAINEDFCKGLTLTKDIFSNITTEKEFPSLTKTTSSLKRFADLYIEENQGKKLYIEIKWEDTAQGCQIEDYLRFVEKGKGKVFFSLLTLYNFPGDVKKISEHQNTNNHKNARHVLFSDLLQKSEMLYKIKKKKGQDTGLLQLFNNFLDDYTMKYKQKIKKGALQALMSNSIGMPNRFGRGRLNTRDNYKHIPEVWESLLGNLATLGSRFHERFRETKAYGRSPSPFFRFESELSKEKLLRKINACDKKEKSLAVGQWSDLEAVNGWFTLYNSVVIKNSSNLGARFGFSFRYDPLEFYAVTWFTDVDDYYGRRKMKLASQDGDILLPDADRLYSQIVSLLKGQIEKWLKDNKDNMDKENKEDVTSCKRLCAALHHAG